MSYSTWEHTHFQSIIVCVSSDWLKWTTDACVSVRHPKQPMLYIYINPSYTVINYDLFECIEFYVSSLKYGAECRSPRLLVQHNFYSIDIRYLFHSVIYCKISSAHQRNSMSWAAALGTGHRQQPHQHQQQSMESNNNKKKQKKKSYNDGSMMHNNTIWYIHYEKEKKLKRWRRRRPPIHNC